MPTLSLANLLRVLFVVVTFAAVFRLLGERVGLTMVGLLVVLLLIDNWVWQWRLRQETVDWLIRNSKFVD